MPIIRFISLILCFVFFSIPAKAQEPLKWLDWSDAVFKQAQSEKKYVLLDLEAVWCHWCHFMEERTYRHPDVMRFIRKGFVPVRADQDAHPELASRYGDWGWPATIIFDAEGKEIAKFQGFIRPSLMIQYLHTILNSPGDVPPVYVVPQVETPAEVFLSQEQRKIILGLRERTYDIEYGGWGRRLKFLHADNFDYALLRSRQGDKLEEKRVRAGLDAALALLDREWGGIYQYSHERDWSAPHYEKIMWFQAHSMRLYAHAYAQFGDVKYLKASQNIYRYLSSRLKSPEGAFYTSQDADVDSKMLGKEFYSLKASQRAALGREPRIDKHLYARENGWAIQGLLALYGVSGDERVLKDAIAAARWVLANRSLKGGGFSHGAKDKAGPYLADNLAMGRAFLDLYTATGKREWLKLAVQSKDFIEASFRSPKSGYVTAKNSSVTRGIFKQPFVNIEENTRLARFANLLHRYHGPGRHRETAENAMRYLTSDKIVKQRRFLVGILMADDELAVEPPHITVVGDRSSEGAQSLHRAALRLGLGVYKRIDFWDPREGPMMNPDVTYPELERPAAFACANGICSFPIYEAKKMSPVLNRFMRKRVVKR